MGADIFNEELLDMLREFLESGEIEANSAAHGATKQVIDMGYDSLTEKQRWVYDHEVAPLVKRAAEERRINSVILSNPPD